MRVRETHAGRERKIRRKKERERDRYRKLWPNADELHSFYGKVFWTLL